MVGHTRKAPTPFQAGRFFVRLGTEVRQPIFCGAMSGAESGEQNVFGYWLLGMERGTLLSAPMEQESGINNDKNRSGVMHQRSYHGV